LQKKSHVEVEGADMQYHVPGVDSGAARVVPKPLGSAEEAAFQQ